MTAQGCLISKRDGGNSKFLHTQGNSLFSLTNLIITLLAISALGIVISLVVQWLTICHRKTFVRKFFPSGQSSPIALWVRHSNPAIAASGTYRI